jgi:hypothetical protein
MRCNPLLADVSVDRPPSLKCTKRPDKDVSRNQCNLPSCPDIEDCKLFCSPEEESALSTLSEAAFVADALEFVVWDCRISSKRFARFFNLVVSNSAGPSPALP